MDMVVDECCRFCGKCEPFKVYLYGPYCKKQDISKKVRYCLSLNISERDGYSKYICYKCMANVDSFYEFRLMANKIHTSHRPKSQTTQKVVRINSQFINFKNDDRNNTFFSESDSSPEGKDDEDEDFVFSWLRKRGRDATGTEENGFNRIFTNDCGGGMNKKAASMKSQSNSFLSSLARSGKASGNEKPLANVNLNLDGRKRKSEDTRMQFKKIFESIVGDVDEEPLFDRENRKKGTTNRVPLLRQASKKKKAINKMATPNQLSADLFESLTPDHKSPPKGSFFGSGDSLMEDLSIMTFSDWQLTEEDSANKPKKNMR